MTCRVDLRHNQAASQIESVTASGGGVCIYAPAWVQEGMDILTTHLNGSKFEVHSYAWGSDGIQSDICDVFEIKTGESPLTLKTLQMIARCEPRNVTGVINKLHYIGLEDDVIYAIRDLVRQCIVVGLDETTHYGGYPSGSRNKQEEPVYVVDLSGLQFQQAYNTGRLVLVKDKLPFGLLDDLIFRKVVGEPRKSFQEIQAQSRLPGSRYSKYVCPRSGHNVDAFFDIHAYRRFVAMDVLLSGIAVHELASKNGHLVNFKFLKYGTGYFAGNMKEHLEEHLFPGVLDGLERFFKEFNPTPIRSLEFPFYRLDPNSKERLDDLKSTFGVNYKISHDDALKNTTKEEGLVTATTNCGDPHAACGNEMGFSSVDGAIAENLKSRGNIFCPCLNKNIQSKLIELS